MLRFLGLASVLGTAAIAVFAPDARAMGALLTSPPGAASAAEVHIALATAGTAAPSSDSGDGAMTRTTRWASLRVHGAATAFAWVLPVRAGAWVDLASEGWLEALEEATAPRVVPPDVSPPCGIAGGVEVEGDVSHAATLVPDAVVVAPDGVTLAMGLASWGLAVPRDLAAAIDAAVAGGDAFLALHFTAPLGSTPAPDLRTHTVRITEDEPAPMSSSVAGLSLSGGDGTSLAVTAHGVAGGPVTWLSSAGTPPALPPSSILWQPDGTSTYAAARDALLQDLPGSWLEETSGHRILFQAVPVPGHPSVPALAGAYFARARMYGDAADDPDTCEARALAVATSASTVALACLPGALAMVGSPGPCREVVGAGEIAPDVLRCGGIADDLALALSGLAPGGAYLTRARSVIPVGVFGRDEPLQPAQPSTISPRGPVVTAGGYTLTCVTGNGARTVAADPGTGGWGTGVVGVGVAAGASGGAQVPSDPVTDPGSGGAGDDSTSGDSISDDSCGGDSSSSSTDPSSGDGCGGGSGSGSEGSGSGGDSSSSDSCSHSGGSDSSSDSSNCSTGGRLTRGRSWVSRIGLSLVLLAGVLRRSSRRRTAARLI
jgi:hypothetical protein